MTSTPLSRPASPPTTSTATIANHRGQPAANKTPRTALDKPRTDATDRSISPTMMISVIDRTMIDFSLKLLNINEKLVPFRK